MSTPPWPAWLPPRTLLLALIAGGVMPFAFAPFNLFWLAPVALAVLFAAWQSADRKSGFLAGLGFGFTSFIGGTYWTFISIREFGGAPVILAAAAMLGLALLLALFVAAAGWAQASWRRCGPGVRNLIVLPALWVLAEWCRGWMLTGFGWLAAGYSQSDSWLMGLAPIGGVHAVSAAVALSGGALVLIVQGDWRRRLLALVCIGLAWSGAGLLRSVAWTHPDGEIVPVALAQGGIGQEIKWSPANYANTLAIYRELTAQAAGARIIVWPEVAIPNVYSAAAAYLGEIRQLAQASGGIVLTGILADAQPAPQNALVALTAQPQFYIKRHLVPFGEYFPIPGFARNWLRLLDLPYSDLAAGEEGQPLLEVAGQRIAVTICYEDVFGSEQLPLLTNSTLLVNVSNDAWFGDSIAPHQHLQIARMRAVEAGRFMLRATGTGVSAVIDPAGTVVATLPQFESAVLLSTVQGRVGMTPFMRAGNWPIILLVLSALAGAQLPVTRLTMRPAT